MLRPSEDKMIRPQEDKQLTVERCPYCGHILGRMRLSPGSVVELKCGCNRLTTLKAV
jgi:hypothetical protein